MKTPNLPLKFWLHSAAISRANSFLFHLSNFDLFFDFLFFNLDLSLDCLFFLNWIFLWIVYQSPFPKTKKIGKMNDFVVQ